MKALKEESLLKQVSKKLKSLSEPELQKIDEWIDEVEREKFDAMMTEFGIEIGMDRPFLQLVKKGKTSSSNKKAKKTK
ncbi:hypothetical protein [Leptospira interrogans]|uniref:hypothetical protein n=1 Tax=Leptospira interrogans TaxID=173 RepID=UPI00193B34C8|nr:hypothetical protein [Leptospira interrogans]MBM2890572.1 hypothetical protein [Leptospira interrogans]